MAEFGYTGVILKVDLSEGKTHKLETAYYADRFLGGRGVAAKIYWDEVSPGVGAFDPENIIMFITGPVAGFARLAGSRWQVCGKSPALESGSFSYANLGGNWGARLKFAGYDGIVVSGKSEKPVYLFVHDGLVEIRDASHLWGKTTFEVCDVLKSELGKEVRVLTIGPAGENGVSFSTMLADDGTAGSSGFASVMGSKKLKAVVVIGNKRPKAADPERVQSLADRVYSLRKGTWDGYMQVPTVKTKYDTCYGCVSGCFRQSYQAENGRRFKFFCQATDVYRRPALKYYDGWSDVPLLAIRLCDRYGLDTAVMQPMIEWLNKCYKEGVLSDEETGMPLSKMGSSEFIEVLVKKLSYREGFGDILAQGTIKTAELYGKRARELIGYSVVTRASENKDYDPRLILTNALLYATETRRPIQQLHEVSHTLLFWLDWIKGEKTAFLSTDAFRNIAEKFWGGAVAADLSTYEGKALSAKKIQDRTYAKESLILCDLLWPIIWVRYSEDHVGDPTLESQVFSAITGKEVDMEKLDKIGERIFNLQRAVLIRDGWQGRKGDRLLDYLHDEPIQYVRFNRECTIPGKSGEITSRKGERIDRDKFECMKDEYYQLRGWDLESGYQTEAKMKELGLSDIAGDLKKAGRLK